MYLPNADQAIVEDAKVTEYLLNHAHRFGASKARFFAAFGFSAASPRGLAEALRRHAAEGRVAGVVETGFGPRYEVDGQLDAPDGRRPRVRTVWQFDAGGVAPRLITAYPLDEP